MRAGAAALALWLPACCGCAAPAVPPSERLCRLEDRIARAGTLRVAFEVRIDDSVKGSGEIAVRRSGGYAMTLALQRGPDTAIALAKSDGRGIRLSVEGDSIVEEIQPLEIEVPAGFSSNLLLGFARLGVLAPFYMNGMAMGGARWPPVDAGDLSDGGELSVSNVRAGAGGAVGATLHDVTFDLQLPETEFEVETRFDPETGLASSRRIRVRIGDITQVVTETYTEVRLDEELPDSLFR